MKYTYSGTKQKLDEILEKIQDPATDLDQALELHAEAKKLLKELTTYLKEVEKKVTKAIDG